MGHMKVGGIVDLNGDVEEILKGLSLVVDSIPEGTVVDARIDARELRDILAELREEHHIATAALGAVFCLMRQRGVTVYEIPTDLLDETAEKDLGIVFKRLPSGAVAAVIREGGTEDEKGET